MSNGFSIFSFTLEIGKWDVTNVPPDGAVTKEITSVVTDLWQESMEMISLGYIYIYIYICGITNEA